MKEIYKIEKQELKQYLNEGKTYQEIAEIYGCSFWTILNRVNIYNLTDSVQGKSTSKLGDKNPMKNNKIKHKVSNIISNYYKEGVKMGFQTMEKVAHKINIKRDKCEFCGSTKNLKHHHIDGNQSNHLKTNLEILCNSCHIAKHYQPYMLLTKRFIFEAAHRLVGMGKCDRLHGHSYKLEVTVGGRLNKDGMVMNFSKINEIVKRKIIEKLDHYFLNDIFSFTPTAEGMLVWIFQELNNELKGLKEIKLWETESSYAVIKDTHFTDMFGE
jgi:6-pyruvoyltetrahydropterin/6-carboxytetrahydropterin synthase